MQMRDAQPVMDRRFPSRPGPVDPHETRALVACALWLHVAYVGGVTAVAGILAFRAGGFGWTRMLALIVCGVLLAVASLRRARDVLTRATPEPAMRPPRLRKTPAGLVVHPGRG